MLMFVEILLLMLWKNILTKILTNDDNFIDRLLDYYKEKEWKTPKYIEMPCEHDQNKKIYKYGVTGKDGKIRAIGIACSKKKARQNAAKQALKKFKVIE
jgi:dsRNA-specific ribonuclease